MKLWWLHHDGAGLRILSTSATCSAFHCLQLHLELPKCHFQVVRSHHYVRSCCWFYVSCHLQLIAELAKILSLLLNHCHDAFSCVSGVPVVIPSNLHWSAFMALTLLFSSFWQVSSFPCKATSFLIWCLCAFGLLPCSYVQVQFF